jgi:hypothetical protein
LTKAITKKPVYQPPKLKTKNQWMPQNEENNSNKSSESEIEEEKSKLKPKPQNRNMTHYDNFTNYDLEKDPKMEYNSTKKTKNLKSTPKKCETVMNSNTMTTFSRLNEERDNEPTHQMEPFNDFGVDNRVE